MIPHLTRSHDKYYTLFKDKKFFDFLKNISNLTKFKHNCKQLSLGFF